MRMTGELRQVPVYRRIRYFKGDEEISGQVPIAGGVQAKLRQSGVTVSQIERVTTTVTSIPQLAAPFARADLIVRLDRSAPSVSVDMGRLAAVIRRHLAVGRAREIFRALHEQATTEAELLSVHLVEDCWRRQEWIAPALRCFTAVTAQQTRTAYFRAVPSSDNGEPQDLDEAMDFAAAYGRRPAGIAPLHRFVAILEHMTQEKVPDDWWGIAPDRLNAIRMQAAAPHAEVHRLVIDLRNPVKSGDAFDWPEVVAGYLYMPSKGWKRAKTTSTPDVSGAQKAVGHLVEWANDQGIASFVMGLIVPRPGLDTFPEEWTCGDILEEPSPMQREWPVVLHSAERLSTPRARAWWREKAAAIKLKLADEAPEVLWIEPVHRDSPASIRTTVRTTEASCFGLAFAPGTFCQDLRRDPIVATVAAGAPYLVWTDHEPTDWSEIKQLLKVLAGRGAFEELPIRLHRARAHDPNWVGGRLRLIWDEPEALPPFGRLTGILDESVSNG